jgi:ATP-dependent Clp protease ATP-binding subunit ClpA
MDMEDYVPKRADDPLALLLKQDLDPLSIDELHARIALLENEIDRIRGKIDHRIAFQRRAHQRLPARQRAILHVQSSGKDEVTGANVLVALFSERESYAVYFLQQQDMSRLDAVSYHQPRHRQGRTLDAGAAAGARRRGREEAADQGREARRRDALDQFTSTSTRRRGGQGRSADRPRARSRAHDPDPVPPPKNNPLYVGDPGVGKTAIAEGLARKIIEGDVPEVLKPKAR